MNWRAHVLCSRKVLFIALASVLYSPACFGIEVTYVAPDGDNGNAGLRDRPCLTFGGAYTKTDTGGEINVIESGSFGPLVISKSITIDGGGAQSAIHITGGANAIRIAAGASSVITLRNLVLNGLGSGGNGIRFESGATLNIENCTILGFDECAIDIARTATGYVTISNCTIQNCGDSGIRASTTAGNVYADIENVRIRNCGIGFYAGSGSRFTIRNSSLNSNGIGVRVTGPSSVSKAVIDDCIISNGSTGISVSNGGSVARIKECTIVQNSTGFATSLGGSIESNGTNTMIGNATQGPAPSPIQNI
jgi:hypothetical protein